ncbi:MAG: hypothetical protein RDU25_03725 [Patescibacteria group bacterium]|nr:hypothetical protein [Patescibacteria group bacterium]
MPEMNDEGRLAFAGRVEWISLVYLVIFVFAVMSPSIVRSDFLGIPEAHVEEILIFIFGLVGLATFSLYERIMEKRLKERDEAQDTAKRALNELIESYKYIGSINRHIELLQKLVNQTSLSLVDKSSYGKDILQSMITDAVSIVKAENAFIRVMELDKLRTEYEIYHKSSESSLKVANKELRSLHQYSASHAFVGTEDGKEVLVVPSDRKQTGCKAYLLMKVDPSKITEIDISLLKVFVNQAELVYHQLLRKKENNNGTALQHVDDVSKMVTGDVG